MVDFIMQNVDLNTLVSVVAVTALFVYLCFIRKHVSPELLQDFSLALSAFGMLSKNKDAKSITIVVQRIVEAVQQLDVDYPTKKKMAVEKATQEITTILGFQVSEQAIKTLVDIAFIHADTK